MYATPGSHGIIVSVAGSSVVVRSGSPSDMMSLPSSTPPRVVVTQTPWQNAGLLVRSSWLTSRSFERVIPRMSGKIRRSTSTPFACKSERIPARSVVMLPPRQKSFGTERLMRY